MYGTLYPQKIQDHSRLRNTFGYPRKYPLFQTYVPESPVILTRLTHDYPTPTSSQSEGPVCHRLPRHPVSFIPNRSLRVEEWPNG